MYKVTVIPVNPKIVQHSTVNVGIFYVKESRVSYTIYKLKTAKSI